MSQIMTKIYPVKSAIGDAPKREELEKLETSLHQWYFNLPEHLTYSDMSRRVAPLPHILLLHMEYQFAVLLLHRALYVHLSRISDHMLTTFNSLPNWNECVEICLKL